MAFDGGEIDPLTDWFRAVKGWTTPAEVVDRWRRAKGTPASAAWQWAALVVANATDVTTYDEREYPALPPETIQELLAAPTREPDTPGAVTEAYHRARLLLDTGHAAEAVPIIERAIQLDFDALRSQRDLYAQLLVDLRAELPMGQSLGITALASWCVGDPWLDDLPEGTLDYAVPMLFRMGPDALRIRSFVEKGGTFRSQRCRGDVGLSTDEPQPAVGSGVRRWVFGPVAWDGWS